MRIERWIILILGITLLRMLWRQYRRRLRRWWKQTKDQLPRHWQPKSLADCPLCCAEMEQTPEQALEVEFPEAYAESKTRRGRKKTVQTEGYACPDVDCKYYRVTEAARHALVGHGKLGENKDIQRLKCQACGGRVQLPERNPAILCQNRGGRSRRSLVVVGRRGRCVSPGEKNRAWRENSNPLAESDGRA